MNRHLFSLAITSSSLVLAALSAGCANVDAKAMDEANHLIVTCAAGPDCTEKWDAAQLWIVNNAGFKLQTVTGVLLQTYGPSTVTQDSTRIAVTATREILPPAPDAAADAPRRYRIRVAVSCGNPFGCHPDYGQATLAFKNAVNAAGTPASPAP